MIAICDGMEIIMSDIKDSKKAARVFEYFEEIANIPHTSGNTSPIADYLVSFAKGHGLEYIRDGYDNVIIKKNATPGYEGKPPIIIQGHTDMVAAVEDGRDVDMEKVGVKIIRDGDFLTADGTTLGADDGIFMAYALAILDSDDIKHPALEALFTSDEETGLVGAGGLDASALSGKRMINIDSDMEGIFTVGCAGGMRVDLTLPFEHCKNEEGLYAVTVTGLLGGHSGMEIDKGRENAIKILFEAIEGSLISSVKGGNADNAIPRNASAIVKPSSLEKLSSEVIPALLNKYRAKEEAIEISVIRRDGVHPVYSPEDSGKIINAVHKTPTGVYKMSAEVKNLPETSSNLGIIDTSGGRVTLSTSIRSSKNAEKLKLRDMIAMISKEYGATLFEQGEYPAWEYKKDSSLREGMVRIYEEKYGHSPEVVIIHAGLECGIFSKKIDGLDCVSIGPDMLDIHTTEERLSIPSAIRVYDYLITVLEEL